MLKRPTDVVVHFPSDTHQKIFFLAGGGPRPETSSVDLQAAKLAKTKTNKQNKKAGIQ